MTCPKCGTLNQEGVAFCANCGTALQQNPTQPVQSPNFAPVGVPGKGFAIASLILGIVSLIIAALPCGTMAVIFAVLAKKKGFTGGMATAGIACGVVGLSLWLITLIACQGSLVGLGF